MGEKTGKGPRVLSDTLAQPGKEAAVRAGGHSRQASGGASAPSARDEGQRAKAKGREEKVRRTCQSASHLFSN